MKKILFSFLGIIIAMASWLYADSNTKEPNVAGQFYPADPEDLSRQIDKFWKSTSRKPHDQTIPVLIAPHAGYVYSGAVAVHSFKAAARGRYSTIILIGPSHFFDFEGISVWQKGLFRTPLGGIPVDQEFAEALIKSNPQFGFKPEVFSKEHSLEVELPFLQETFKDLKDFTIVPILMGRPDYKVCQNLSLALDQLIGKREDVLIVLSTDLSHYHEAQVAQLMDQKTLSLIKDLNAEELWNRTLRGETELCGFTPVVTGLLYAQKRNLKAELLKYAHSGDATGDNSRVVGYSAVIFTRNPSSPNLVNAEKEMFNADGRGLHADGRGFLGEDSRISAFDLRPSALKDSLTLEQRKRLLQIAQDTVKKYVETGEVLAFQETDRRLHKEEGAFVTLRKGGALRGCIGQIIPRGPLFLTVRDMAISAAAKDPRFPPVDKSELNDLEVEVSVLSIPRLIRNVDDIQLGLHGVILSHRLDGHLAHGVFLPQVATETGWTKEEFLSQLCSQKAELPPECWKDPTTTIEIFTADVFSEKDILE